MKSFSSLAQAEASQMKTYVESGWVWMWGVGEGKGDRRVWDWDREEIELIQKTKEEKKGFPLC